MNLFKKFCVVTCLIGISSSYARAGLDVTGNYTVALSNPSDLNNLNQALLGSSYPKLGAVAGFGFDGAFYFPGRLGLGVRYEQLSNQISSGNVSQTVTATRGAILAGYRLIDFIAYLGVVGTYGITHTMKASTTGLSDLAPSSMSSYSVGVEAGTHIGFLMLGAEAGYLSFVGKTLQSNGTNVTYNGNTSNLDLSGVYLKGVAGISL